MNEKENLKKQAEFYKKINNILVFLLIFVLISLPLTLALYKDYFSQDMNLDFGNININVKDGVTDSQTLTLSMNRTGTGQVDISTAMPGDEITMSLKISLASGSDPCYYIVSMYSTSEIFGEAFNSNYFYENGNVYIIDETTRHLINNPESTTSSYCGSLDSGAVILNIATTIPITANEDTFARFPVLRANVSVYAVQKANLTQLEAYTALQEMQPLYYYCDADGSKNASGTYIAYGKYPQTVKASGVTLSDSVDENGYYTGSDGEKYVRISANKYDANSVFSNGSTITNRATYYFKLEPIVWQVLKTENGQATLITKNIIDSIAYQINYINTGKKEQESDLYNLYLLQSGVESYDGDVSDGTEYANNYKFSYLRTWLNTTFLNTFTLKEKTIINTTTVDNGKSTTNNNSNRYVPQDYTTSDKVFVLSYQEYNMLTYFADNTARQKQGSDYAKVKYLLVGTNLFSHYWGRSVHSSRSFDANFVMMSGSVYGGDNVYDQFIGVCPALVIQL